MSLAQLNSALLYFLPFLHVAISFLYLLVHDIRASWAVLTPTNNDSASTQI